MIFKTKSDWPILKKEQDNRIFQDNGVLIIFEVTIILAPFIHKPQLNHTCKPCLKCLKTND